jgi:predicted DNA-binding transcriptional regulator AlpA
VGRPVDLDDLIDAREVAELLGLARRSAVTVYRSRYSDFPLPVRTSEGGRCLLWLRQDVEGWARATGRLE